MSHSLRWRVLGELSILLLLSSALLLRFPHRPAWVNVVLALFGLGLVWRNLTFTRDVVWPCSPAPEPRQQRVERSLSLTVLFTVTAMVAMAAFAWWRDGNAPELSIRLLLILPLYCAWGLLQQALFQYFLLGRLLVVLPPGLAISATALAFALVHITQPTTAILTFIAGLVWTKLYYHYRILWPLAASHALLGATLFHWIYQVDLFQHWRGY